MKSFQRLASAARGTLWLLCANGLRGHVAKLENRLNALDTEVVHVASQSTSALRMADNLQRLEKHIREVMADVTSQHATTVRVAENVQRLGKHIVDVAANNLTNGRLSEQLQKLEKSVGDLGAGHLANGKLADQFRRLESALAGSQNYDKLKEPLQKLEKQVADLTAAHSGLAEQLRDMHKHLEGFAASEPTAKRLQSIEQRLDQVYQLLERGAAALAAGEERPLSACKAADFGSFTLCVATVFRPDRPLAA